MNPDLRVWASIIIAVSGLFLSIVPICSYIGYRDREGHDDRGTMATSVNVTLLMLWMIVASGLIAAGTVP